MMRGEMGEEFIEHLLRHLLGKDVPSPRDEPHTPPRPPCHTRRRLGGTYQEILPAEEEEDRSVDRRQLGVGARLQAVLVQQRPQRPAERGIA